MHCCSVVLSLLLLQYQNIESMFIGKGCFLCDPGKIEIDFSEFNPTSGGGDDSEPPGDSDSSSGAFLKEKHSDCRDVRDGLLNSTAPDTPFIPICDTEGYYLSLQCSKPSKSCWCVDKKTGEKIADSDTPMDKGPPKCAKWPIEAVTATSSTKPTPRQLPPGICKEARAKMEEKYHEKQVKDAWLVECDEQGNFVPLQCNVNTSKCVCVHKISGRELQGTQGTVDNKPDCNSGAPGGEKPATQVPPQRNNHRKSRN